MHSVPVSAPFLIIRNLSYIHLPFPKFCSAIVWMVSLPVCKHSNNLREMQQASMRRWRSALISSSVPALKGWLLLAISYILPVFTETSVPLINTGMNDCTLSHAFWIICSVSGVLLLSCIQNLIAAVCAFIITVTMHKKLIYKTCHSSAAVNRPLIAAVNRPLMKFGHVLKVDTK